MKQVLFVWFKKYDGILEGGGIANHRNVTLAEHLFGKENIGSVYVHDDMARRSIWNYAVSVALFPFGYFNGLTPRIIREVVSMAQDYNYVFINTSILGIIARHLKAAGYKGRIITHFHNVESKYYEDRVPKYLPFRSLIVRCAKMNDRYSLVYSDKTVALSERDGRLLQEIHGIRPGYYVPVTFADKCRNMEFDRTAMTANRPLCLFLGSNFPANAEGVLWFVRNVLPHVDIRFMVVGKDMAKLQKENDCLSGIEVVSDAPDLVPYLERADFLVLPIFSGSGMKVKTCEALMYGKNIIGTDETFAGYDLEANRCGARCNSAQEFIDVLDDYCKHPVHRYNDYSRQAFLSRYSEGCCIDSFKKLFDV